VSTALLVVGCALLLVPCSRRLGLLHPVSVTVLLWLVLSLLIAAAPLDLVVPDVHAAGVILAGLVALCLGPLVLDTSRVAGGAGTVAASRSPSFRMTVRPWRLGLAAVVVVALVTWGVLEYRNAVSAALGQPFGQLSPKLVRWAEVYGNLQMSSAAKDAFGLVAVIGPLGVIGGRCHSRWWYLLVPVALALSAQSPSRTTTLSIAVTTGFFYFLLSRTPGTRLAMREGTVGRFQGVGLVVGTVALALGYFTTVGQQLDKAGTPGLVTAGWVPRVLVAPLLYQLGGASAFTVVLDHPTGGAGPYNGFGRSIYGAVKLARLLGADVTIGQSPGSYANIPVPFNTYTAFGDTYFDLGVAGVLVVFFLIGLLVHRLGTWPWPGHPCSVWGLSVVASVLVDSPVHMRILDGDILVAAVAGCLALGFVLRKEAGEGTGSPPRSAGAARPMEDVPVPDVGASSAV
jgi:hypothetical protein